MASAAPIDMNKASYEELRSIPKVGDKTARAILELREQMGTIALEDVKLLPNIPNTIWDPLIQTAVITFEPVEADKNTTHKAEEPKTDHNTMTVDSEKFQQMVDAMQKMQGVIEQQQNEKKELTAQISSMQREFNDELKRKETEIQAEKERNSWFQEQGKLQKPKYVPPSLRTEEKPDVKLAFQHPWAKLVDEIAPGSIYKEDTVDKKMQFTDARPKDRVAKPEQKNEESLSNEQGGRTSAERYSLYRFSEGPPPPKMSTYDGKSDWRPYHLQFNHIAKRYKWTDQQKLDKLVELLRDKALKYYSTKPSTVQDNYQALCKKLNERFGRKDLPHIIRRQLQDLRQNVDEGLEEYNERAQKLATDGYPNTPEEFIQLVATDAFLKGCIEKKAALTAIDKDPNT